MSYEIEYNRKIFVLKAGTELTSTEVLSYTAGSRRWSDEFFLFIKQGCNNVYPRPKDWSLAASGGSCNIIETVCKRAGSTEGANLQFQNGPTTPENYLAKYRHELSKAETLTVEALKSMGITELCFEFVKKDKAQTDEFKTIEKHFHLSEGYWDNLRFTRKLETLDDFFCWLYLQYDAEKIDAIPSLNCKS